MHESGRSAQDKQRSQPHISRIGGARPRQTEEDGVWNGGRTTGHKKKKLPVGVLEANASLLELISILQFGHIFSIDGRLGHGLLETR